MTDQTNSPAYTLGASTSESADGRASYPLPLRIFHATDNRTGIVDHERYVGVMCIGDKPYPITSLDVLNLRDALSTLPPVAVEMGEEGDTAEDDEDEDEDEECECYYHCPHPGETTLCDDCAERHMSIYCCGCDCHDLDWDREDTRDPAPAPRTERWYAVMEQRIESAFETMRERLRALAQDTARVAEEVGAELTELLSDEARDGHRIEADVFATAARTEYGVVVHVVADGVAWKGEVTSLEV
ncbi:hypothetical protein TSOC111612_23905 [Tsukamurella ocularis]|uniref:hypothetical protein n=1 Tax=Tsukamurella ocularis TaxID=1970234 RepID=UPI0039F0BCF6